MTIFLSFVMIDTHTLEKPVQYTEHFSFLSPSFHGEYPLCPNRERPRKGNKARLVAKQEKSPYASAVTQIRMGTCCLSKWWRPKLRFGVSVGHIYYSDYHK